jgi:manganese transport protein
MHGSVHVAQRGHWLRRFFAFVGPGYLVAVGYMDPGNWATDLAGGSAYGYALLWVVLLSSLMAMLLQALAARLGIATGLDLAQACRLRYSRRATIAQWLLCEAAICATDLAEVIGSAIALNLLFGIPLLGGVALTVLDVLLVLWLQQRGVRYLEAIVLALLLTIFVCIVTNLLLAQPQWRAVAEGLFPSGRTLADPAMLYLAIGIVGATVMPHNLYLHSATVQTRRFERTPQGRCSALKFATLDVVIALLFAFVVNAAILLTSAAAFHASGHREVAEIQQAYRLLAPLLGSGLASLLFALALLASGQSSTLTATLAGQIVMEGYVRIRLAPWKRRLLTRAFAVVPALFVTAYYGESGTAKLLILSQVVLSLQLPFAVIPLIRCTSDPEWMGELVNPRWLRLAAWATAGLIVAFNGAMLAGLMAQALA